MVMIFLDAQAIKAKHLCVFTSRGCDRHYSPAVCRDCRIHQGDATPEPVHGPRKYTRRGTYAGGRQMIVSCYHCGTVTNLVKCKRLGVERKFCQECADKLKKTDMNRNPHGNRSRG